MKKEIRVADRNQGIIQVTTTDERWYVKEITDIKTGLPKLEFVPSVTWICEHYPKGIAFYKWLASKGWDEAEAIKVAAGDKGSKVHQAVGDLIKGSSVTINAKYVNPSSNQLEELTLEEYEAIVSFVDWVKESKPTIDPKMTEFAVWGDGYAGTIDMICYIDQQRWLVDFKTSKYIWPSHELQVSAYKHALGKTESHTKLAILQLGYHMNKKRFKFTEVEDQYEEFLATKTIWAKEQKGVEPKQKDYPLSVKLEVTK